MREHAGVAKGLSRYGGGYPTLSDGLSRGQWYAHPASRERNNQIKLDRLVEQGRKEMQESILERLPSNRAIWPLMTRTLESRMISVGMQQTTKTERYD